MEQYVVKNKKKLKYGYTTGSCATGAAKACAIMLLTQQEINSVELDTPKGWVLSLSVLDITLTDKGARCAIQKDSGDDPDITNGALIYATVRLAKSGINIDGGQGVGRVTLKGLACNVGEAAINPKPRAMIKDNLIAIAKEYGYTGGFDVFIEVPEGERLAKKTFNEKLGIVGGISILGTTGIVEPMSMEALKKSIALEINILKNKDVETLLFCPGNYGARFAENQLHLSTNNMVKVSNFIGDMLEHARQQAIKKVLLVSHIGKGIKLAGRMFNTHSHYGDCRIEIFSSYAIKHDVPYSVLKDIVSSVTTDNVIDCLNKVGKTKEVLRAVANDVEGRLVELTDEQIEIGVILFSNEHGLLSVSNQGERLLKEFKACEK